MTATSHMIAILLVGAAQLGAADVPAPDPANQFADPSFELGLGHGKSGRIQVYYEGAPLVDQSGAKAHSGRNAIGMQQVDAAGKRVFFQMGGEIIAGKPFQFKSFFRSEKEGGRVHLQVNLNDSTKVFQGDYPVSTTWEEKVLAFEVPADAKPGAILIIQGGAQDNVLWMDDIYFGEAK